MLILIVASSSLLLAIARGFLCSFSSALLSSRYILYLHSHFLIVIFLIRLQVWVNDINRSQLYEFWYAVGLFAYSGNNMNLMIFRRPSVDVDASARLNKSLKYLTLYRP